jgi:alpha-galactosidase
MRVMQGLATLLFAVELCCPPLSGQTTAAAKPPMGWNSWNHFAGHVTDADVRSAADSLVSTGMRDAGCVYVNVDDTWEGKRDAQGMRIRTKSFRI